MFANRNELGAGTPDIVIRQSWEVSMRARHRALRLCTCLCMCLCAEAAGNVISVDAGAVITQLPPEMNGAGCGIEFIEHEIVGGLDPQLVVDEGFEYPHNTSTGLSDQWAIGGPDALFGTTHRLVGAGNATALGLPAPFNGLQYLAMRSGDTKPVWSQSGGLNMQGMTFAQGKGYEGYVFLATNTPGVIVEVQLQCGANDTFATPSSALASKAFALRTEGSWRQYNISSMATQRACAPGQGSVVVFVQPGAPRGSVPQGVWVGVDMVFLQPSKCVW